MEKERLEEITWIYDRLTAGAADEGELIPAFGDALDEIGRLQRLLHAVLGGASLEHACAKFREWSNLARDTRDEYWYEYWGRMADATSAYNDEERAQATQEPAGDVPPLL